MHFKRLVIKIKERRQDLQITQEDLSKLSGVGLRTLKHIETGKGNPTIQTLIKLTDVLGLEIVLKVKELIDETSEDII
jgi:transcriptional regulator with XRE-family HTH domain